MDKYKINKNIKSNRNNIRFEIIDRKYWKRKRW
jgi:hypothetical protein